MQSMYTHTYCVVLRLIIRTKFGVLYLHLLKSLQLPLLEVSSTFAFTDGCFVGWNCSEYLCKNRVVICMDILYFVERL
jgi:hypothetical protein